MSKVIEFHRPGEAATAQLSDVRPVPEDKLAARPSGMTATEADVEHHWGVALALASWPICLGAGAVWLVL